MSDPMPTPRPDAREQTIEQYLPLVRTIARRFTASGEPLDDLVQAGSIGLIKAVDRFDPDRGPALAAFAAPVIEGEIRHHLRRRRRHAMRETAEPPERLDGGAPGGEQSEARLMLADSWKGLPERERRLLELRFFHDLTQAEIARELKMSQANVSRLLRATLERLGSELDDAVAPPREAAYSGPEMPPEVQREEQSTHSGRLLVRMPQSLHAELARTAEREGVSLNALIMSALASAVGWRQGDPAPEGDEAEPPPPAPATAENATTRRWSSVALVANLVVVALAAIVAIALLVTVWQGG